MKKPDYKVVEIVDFTEVVIRTKKMETSFLCTTHISWFKRNIIWSRFWNRKKQNKYKLFKEMIDENGGVMPDIYEITKEDYEDNEIYDVF